MGKNLLPRNVGGDGDAIRLLAPMAGATLLLQGVSKMLRFGRILKNEHDPPADDARLLLPREEDVTLGSKLPRIEEAFVEGVGDIKNVAVRQFIGFDGAEQENRTKEKLVKNDGVQRPHRIEHGLQIFWVHDLSVAGTVG